MKGQRSNFPEIGNFSNLQVRISKTIKRIDTIPSPSCSTSFNSEQNDVLFWYLDYIVVMYNILEGNNVPDIGKITRGQTWQMVLIDIGNSEEAIKMGLC